MMPKLNSGALAAVTADPPYKSGAEWASDASRLCHQTPFLLTDRSLVRATVAYIQRLLPRVELYYAVKSNRDPELLATLDDLVAGFEIASAGELYHLEKLGIVGERMIFSNPVKVPRHVGATFGGGVRHFAFDSLDELEKLSKCAPGSYVYLRVRVADGGSAFPLSKKFGTSATNAVAYMQQARELGLVPHGLAFHVGSQSERPEAWAAAIEQCGQIIRNLAAHNLPIEILDIGGGLPISYIDRPFSLQPIAAAIAQALHDHIPSSMRVIAEPGRAIAGPSSIIVATIIGRESRGPKEEWLFLDMGAFQGLMEPLQMKSWRYPIFTDYMSHGESQQLYTLTGPTCDPDDTLGDDYRLPSRLKAGDRIYIGAAGAYTSVYGSHFNGFEPPESYFLG